MVETFKNDQLVIDRNENAEEVNLRFSGKSILRDPSDFVLPILIKGLEAAEQLKKRLTMDFRELSYMNSSTFTPVIKVLERARLGDTRVRAIYRKGLKWQEISFSALTIFCTQDGRIDIQGLE